ncbi:MAG: DUF2254 domain-containing protein [Phycisphaerales bacterium JB050]
MNRISIIWNRLRATFWFLPSIITASGALLAILFIHLDAQGLADPLPDWPLLFDASPDGARVMLSTIAGSIMTVLGVVFSMILVTLSLAASQYSSRIIRNFMRDRATQCTLGAFAAIFVYCLIVLRVIPSDRDEAFVPILAVTFGVLFSLGGVGVIIFFIHHIASSIQASSVIAAASSATLAAIDRRFPPLEQSAQHHAPSPPDFDQALWHPIQTDRHGYIQSVNFAALLGAAKQLDAVIRIERCIGDFVVTGDTIASVASDPRPNQAASSKLRAAFTLDACRTVEQDPAYGIQQIVDIALRALSPGINDANTAIMCIDHLSACLARLAVRADPHPALPVGEQPQLLCRDPNFATMLDAAFDQIRESAEGNAKILNRLVEAVDTAARLTDQPERRRALQAKLTDLDESIEHSIESSTDLDRLKDRVSRARQIFVVSG